MEAIPLVIVLVLILASVAVWIAALVSVVRTPDESFAVGSKVVWLLVVLFGQFVGAVVYLWLGHPSRAVAR